MASMLTCYAEKRACYSLISYKTKKTQSCTDRSRAETSNVRVRRSPSLRETGCWKSIGLPLAPTEVERRYEPFESGRTRLYTKGILLGYLLYIRRARDGTRTRDPDLGKVVLHQLSHSRIKSAIHKHMDTILYERGFVNRKTAKSQKKFKLYMLLTQ